MSWKPLHLIGRPVIIKSLKFTIIFGLIHVQYKKECIRIPTYLEEFGHHSIPVGEVALWSSWCYWHSGSDSWQMFPGLDFFRLSNVHLQKVVLLSWCDPRTCQYFIHLKAISHDRNQDSIISMFGIKVSHNVFQIALGEEVRSSMQHLLIFYPSKSHSQDSILSMFGIKVSWKVFRLYPEKYVQVFSTT